MGSQLVGALERAWAAIRVLHPEVPAAVMITGAGSSPRRRGLLLGHFAASRWQLGTDTERAVGEVFVGGEGLARGARSVLGTLLHEAAHALAFTRGVKDTSRQGRYHNARFRDLAQELGLEVEHRPELGWSDTTPADATSDHYHDAIARLERALTAYREGEQPARPDSRAGGVACVCSCGRRIRVAPGVLKLGPILCAMCGKAFEPPVIRKRSMTRREASRTSCLRL